MPPAAPEKPEATKRLHSLEPTEISLVRRGANRRKFLMLKSQQPGPTPDLLNQVRAYEFSPAQRDQVAAAVAKAAEAPDGQQRLNERAQAALKATARILAPFADQLCASDLTDLAEAVGLQGADAADDDDEGAGDAGPPTPTEEVAMADQSKAPPKGDIEMDMDAPEGVNSDVHKAGMQAAKAAYVAQLSKKAYGDKADTSDNDEADEEEEEDMSKTADKVGKSAELGAFAPEQRQQLEAVLKSQQLLQERVAEEVRKSAELEKQLGAERDHRLTREYVAKAAGYTHLSCDKDELAATLRGFGERGDAKGLAQFERVLKAADTQLAKGQEFGGLYAVHGSSRRPEGNSAEAKLQAMADGMVAKGEGKLTPQQAYVRAMESAEGRALYAQADDEQFNSIKGA